MKSKHIDWTLGLRCDHRVWLWPWPWPWIFKVKYRICYISAKNGPVATKRKANISIELQASNVTNGFELDHNRDLWILKVKRDLDLWPHTWPWPWIFMVKFWNSCISEWEGRLTFHKGGGSRSFMTMIMTIWWPSSGVWIYQIVTGVTSVVGVPSTHLVTFEMLWGKCNEVKYLDPLTLMTFPLHVVVLKYVSEVLIGWNHSLLHHLSYAISATIV